MIQTSRAEKRVVVIYWKLKEGRPFEIFSNLKNLCISYPPYNYNTLNNYLSREKKAYENEEVRIERKTVFSRPIAQRPETKREIVPVVKKALMKETNEKQKDVAYWLSLPAAKRLQGVTFLISHSLKRGERTDKSILHQRKLKNDTGKGF